MTPSTLLLVTTALLSGHEPAQSTSEAHRMWVITETVLRRHVEPPARQQMLLDVVRAVYTFAGQPVPPRLARQVSQITTEKEWRSLFARAPVSKDKVDQYANAMMHRLPGEGAFLTADDLKFLGIHGGNRYVGTGIQIRTHETGYSQIIIPFAGGPARRAGARPGDLILAVDGLDMKGHPLSDVVKRIGGQEGKPVTLTVRQPKAKAKRDLHMVRGVVPFENVVGYRRTGETSWEFRPDPAVPIAYLRFEDLTTSTAHQLRKIEQQIIHSGERALVLDLRDLRAEELHYAEQVADALIDGGLLWKVRHFEGTITEVHADRDCLFRGWPIAVLVDGTTHGKGALIALALKKQRNAVVVGEPYLIDPYVTTIVDLPEGLGKVQMATDIVMTDQPPALLPGAALRGVVMPYAGYSRPDIFILLNASDRLALEKWNREQFSPEPVPGARRPKDLHLEAAMAALEKRLKKTEKRADNGASAPRATASKS